jgi:hypothetical protein
MRYAEVGDITGLGEGKLKDRICLVTWYIEEFTGIVGGVAAQTACDRVNSLYPVPLYRIHDRNGKSINLGQIIVIDIEPGVLDGDEMDNSVTSSGPHQENR